MPFGAQNSNMPSDGQASKPFRRSAPKRQKFLARVQRATTTNPLLYATSHSPYTACEAIVKATRFFLSAIPAVAATFFLGASAAKLRAQDGTQQDAPEKPAEKIPGKNPLKTQEKPTATPAPKIPAEIELLETRVRFEANGNSRKEVHALVKINDELGVRQFARLNFDFNRAFEQIEIPLVRVTHASGGTADVLPSAITDTPNPAVVNAPAYQDVRVKSVRILGLEPGDSLEYRVITTVSNHPLAPDFWLDHIFDRTGVVSHERFELELPASRNPEVRINPATPSDRTDESRQANRAYTVYQWDRRQSTANTTSPPESDSAAEPDIIVSTEQWETLSIRLDERLSFDGQTLQDMAAYENKAVPPTTSAVTPDVANKALQLTQGSDGRAKLVALYDFVSQKIRTVDLPLGSTGFVTRPAASTLASGYGTQEDKFVLLAALTSAVKLTAGAALTGYCDEKGPARPSVFKRLLVSAHDGKKGYWIDPSLEVAPFGLIPPNSGNCAFILNRLFYSLSSTGHEWEKLEAPLPFPATQRVTIEATISSDGALSARAKYVIRGENELLLRTAFHQTPRDKWDGIAQLLALSDGFRGKVSKASASDPYETHDPFTVAYEITQPKLVDWSKRPLNIPAILPLLGLPDPPLKAAARAASSPIDLGTPLDVEISATLRLPPGTIAHIPTGTSVQRDFATYTSQYSLKDATVTASRHLNFILKEIPADRAADYNAFLRTVQNDESQTFTLERADTTPTPPKKP
jgi:hypothetical protein